MPAVGDALLFGHVFLAPLIESFQCKRGQRLAWALRSSSANVRRGGPDMADFVGAIDQGTTSTRFMVFDHAGIEIARHSLEHQQILPAAGYVEHNPV
ncbi:MAG TPA: FGGY family carbohydrate kinase, partial [Acidothermaceae bacterium]